MLSCAKHGDLNFDCVIAIAVLRDKDPGAFIVRDSHSFRGAYGLAMKVATPPPSVLQQSKKGGLLFHLQVDSRVNKCL